MVLHCCSFVYSILFTFTLWGYYVINCFEQNVFIAYPTVFSFGYMPVIKRFKFQNMIFNNRKKPDNTGVTRATLDNGGLFEHVT